MERSVWTDERLDDLVARGESQFELLRGEMREMRTEMREMRTEMREMRTEMREMRTEFAGECARIRRDMFHGAIALFAALVAMNVTMIVQH